MSDFEKAFGEFVDSPVYDRAESDLFSMMRFAYTAGWIAAGGAPPQPGRFVEVVRNVMLTGSPDGGDPD